MITAKLEEGVTQVTYNNPDDLNKTLEAAKSMGLGIVEGTIFHTLGYTSGAVKKKVLEATGKNFLANVSGLAASSGGFAGITALQGKIGSGSGSGGSGSDDARWSDYKVLLKNGTAKGINANIYLANVTGTGSAAGATLNKSNTGLSPMYIMGAGGNIVPSNISNTNPIKVSAGSNGNITYYTNPSTGKKLPQFVEAEVELSETDYNKLKSFMQAGFTAYDKTVAGVLETYYTGTAYLPVEQTRIDGSGAEWTRAYGGYKTEGVVNINESGATTPATTPTTRIYDVSKSGKKVYSDDGGVTWLYE